MTDKPDAPRDPIPSELAQEDESFADLVQEFVDGLDQRLKELSQAVTEQDFNALRTLAHQLKGSAGGYGYPILTEKAAELELHAVGQEFDSVTTDLKTLEQLVARVVVRI